ncbi:unnamed protein product, partial [Musa acuminata subsp. burmannicoides]
LRGGVIILGRANHHRLCGHFTLRSSFPFPFHFTLLFILYCIEGVLFVCSKSSSFRTESMVNTYE